MYSLWLWQKHNHVYHHNHAIEPFHHPENSLHALLLSSTIHQSQPLTTIDLFLSDPKILPFLEGHISDNIHFVPFWGWLLSISKVHLKFVHIIEHIISSVFLLVSSDPLYEGITVGLSICRWKDFCIVSSFLAINNQLYKLPCKSFYITKSSSSIG